MWKSLKAIADTLRELTTATVGLLKLTQEVITEYRTEVRAMRTELAVFTNEVNELKRDLRKPLAEAEILLSKAESRFRSARASEERNRKYERSRHQDDVLDDEEDEPGDFGTAMGPGGGSQGMQPVHQDIAPGPPLDPVEVARAQKFAR